MQKLNLGPVLKRDSYNKYKRNDEEAKEREGTMTSYCTYFAKKDGIGSHCIHNTDEKGVEEEVFSFYFKVNLGNNIFKYKA